MLLGAAIGDAMGAATELRTTAQIEATFGGRVTGFVAAPDDTFARGCPAGSITDDFSQALHLAEQIVARDGAADEETGRAAILSWWGDERYRRFAGPTTQAAVARLSGTATEPEPFFLYRGGQATNGAAMRVAPVGCVAADTSEAVDAAISVSLPTHDNHLAAAAAAVVACGVRAGLQLRGFAGVVDACLGIVDAATARALARTHEVPGAGIAERTRLAVDIARGARDVDEAAQRIAATVGCGLSANEAVPAAIGILAAAPDAMSAITAAVNAGDDADTVATIVGALAGAVSGAAGFPRDLIETVDAVNGIDLDALAGRLAEVSRAGGPGEAGRARRIGRED